MRRFASLVGSLVVGVVLGAVLVLAQTATAREGYVVYTDSNPQEVHAVFLSGTGVSMSDALSRAQSFAGGLSGATVEEVEVDGYRRVNETAVTFVE